MRRTHDGGIADNLWVEHHLRPKTEPTRALIAEMLGRVEPGDEPPRQPAGEPIGPRDLDRLPGEEPGARSVAKGRLAKVLRLGSALLSVPATVAADLTRRWLRRDRPQRARISVTEPELPPPPDWLARRATLAPPRPPANPPVDSLLTPAWTTGILTATLSMQLDDGPIDIERLVDSLARDTIPTSLPRLPRRALSTRVQMLIDLSSRMRPFRADLVDVVTKVGLTVGEGNVTVLRFDGDPLAGAGPGRRNTWVAYEPPPTPRPVLVVSDLGLGATWLRFQRVAAAADCPVVVLTPQRLRDVPAVLRRAMAVIEWDRRTTAASAARAVRR
jgi:hypothetical protein